MSLDERETGAMAMAHFSFGVVMRCADGACRAGVAARGAIAEGRFFSEAMVSTLGSIEGGLAGVGVSRARVEARPWAVSAG